MGNPLQALLSNPAILLFTAKTAQKLSPRLVFGKTAIFSNWQDVREILKRDLDFLIAPMNGERIERVNGPFILGMDRSERQLEERRALYAAMCHSDIPKIQVLVNDEANSFLNTVSKGGTIDVVNGYARPVAARAAALFIGVSGPSEADRMRVIRALFHECFLNLSEDKAVRAKAITAFAELKEWCDQEIGQRKKLTHKGDDMLGRLIAEGALDDDGIRRTVSGTIVGAIDTTATCVAQIMSVVLKRPELRREILKDLDNPARMRGWCWEALRFWPHNPILVRQAANDTQIGDTKIKAGTKITCFTLAAMHDPGAFPHPGIANPERADNLYLHFGGGLHPCAGIAVNGVQIPLLVQKLLQRDPVIESSMEFEGPFPNKLILKLRS
jgi:cytochrome P450